MREGRELEAAAVAARLKAFLAHPEPLASRYLHGIEALPEAAIVLRFAQGKFTLLPGLTAAEAEGLRQAADEFVRRVCLSEHADHYQALCLPRDAPPDAVKESYHLLMALLHPDRQESAAEPWAPAFAQRVNLAYATLGDAQARGEYDKRLVMERPIHRWTGPPAARARAGQVRFAKTLIAVSAVIAALVAVGLIADDDEWSDRSVLQASLARLRTDPVPGSDRPRYVGASRAVTTNRATDAIHEDAVPFDLLKPLVRAIMGGEPNAWAPPPRLEAPAMPVAQARVEAPATAPPVIVPTVLAQAPAPRPTVTVQPPAAAQGVAVAQAPAAARTSPVSTNREIEDLVVALVDSYQAGDTDRLLGLLDPNATGFWRTAAMRQAYSDFFRSTRARRLRIENLAWKEQEGSAHAKGEATVLADYFDRTATVERRVDVELDIVMRDGHARLRRLSLFPDPR